MLQSDRWEITGEIQASTPVTREAILKALSEGTHSVILRVKSLEPILDDDSPAQLLVQH